MLNRRSIEQRRAAGPEADNVLTTTGSIEKNAGYELTLVPAYGRDYRTAEDMLKDWHGGKDFRIETIMSPWCGSYTSVRDLKQFPGVRVKIRYDKLARFVMVSVVDGSVQIDDESLDDEGAEQSGAGGTPSGTNPEFWL